MSQSAPGGVETGIGTRYGVWWPPIPGWCQKLGAKRAFPYFGLCRIASEMATQRVHRGSGPGGPVPSESPRGDGDPGRPPSALWTRPDDEPSHAEAQRPLKNGRISAPSNFASVLAQVHRLSLIFHLLMTVMSRVSIFHSSPDPIGRSFFRDYCFLVTTNVSVKNKPTLSLQKTNKHYHSLDR